MKTIIAYIVVYALKFALSFRYRIRIKGMEKLNPKTLKKGGGIIFMPNHPTYFIDPMMVCLAIWPRFSVRPMIVEYMYYAPFIHGLMKFMNALPIPNFVTSSNSLKRKKGEKVIQTVIDCLKKKENFLIYPAGRVKHSAYEAVGGSSAVHHILQNCPEANVVLVRTKGLWGSRFSRAIVPTAPDLPTSLWDGFKTILKNLIFFTPRREVIIELEPAPDDFPFSATKIDLNKYLEKWYNLPDGLTNQIGKYPGDSLTLVSYSMWGEKYLPVLDSKETIEKTISIDAIPKNVKDKVLCKLAELAEMEAASIKPEMNISSDLGLDSLDSAELLAFLHDQFDISGVPASELTTVGHLMSIAAKQAAYHEEIEDEKGDLSKWKRTMSRQRAYLASGKTIGEVFLNACQIMKDEIACADARVGIVTYSSLKLRAILLAGFLKKLPGEYIGILLPASVAANLLILACQLAKKVPLMVNWTVGARHLESVIKVSSVQTVISSWAFLDRLENVELNGMEDQLIMLEDIIRELTLTDKIKAFFYSKLSTQSIMKVFGLDKISENDNAVLLFTSGTESMPKGVPLSNKNILSNQRAALEAQEMFNDDILFSILPPFHSFGFTITGILGLLAGIRIAYSPDPTDGMRLARGFAYWQSTIMCGAPTFIKGILKSAAADQLKTMRLCVTGAEKAPQDLFQMMEQKGKPNCIAEGYGITECSPVLTLNPPASLHKGVGKALPGVELCIVHPETEKLLPVGQCGLILAKGPNVFSGYLNPGLSSPFTTLNGEKWYKTGDLGHLDEEGYLTISGRMKRFVKMGAEMVSLASVEDALLQIAAKKGWPSNHDGPSLAICAKELPGERPKIFLFSKFNVSIDEINNSLKESGFSNLVRVSSVIQLPEIPIMGTGKVNYRTLEGQYF